MPRPVNNKKELRAVTFDLYNTLLIGGPADNDTDISAQVFSNALHLDGMEMDEDSAAEMFATQFDRSKKDGFTYFERRIATFLDSHDFQVPDTSIQQYAQAIIHSWGPRWTLADDAIDVISVLKQNGIAVGLVTNFDHYPYVRELLTKWELDSLLDAIVISSEVRSDKPAPEIFLHALSSLRVAPEEALHVGDDIVDVEGALDVGMQALQIDHTGAVGSKGHVVGVPVIRTLSELTEHILL
jgi:putative hydrolase of the HAD superfamily